MTPPAGAVDPAKPGDAVEIQFSGGLPQSLTTIVGSDVSMGGNSNVATGPVTSTAACQ